jgi:hypothetical protein
MSGGYGNDFIARAKTTQKKIMCIIDRVKGKYLQTIFENLIKCLHL